MWNGFVAFSHECFGENEQSTYLIVGFFYTGACKQELIFLDWVAKNDVWRSAISVQG